MADISNISVDDKIYSTKDRKARQEVEILKEEVEALRIKVDSLVDGNEVEW